MSELQDHPVVAAVVAVSGDATLLVGRLRDLVPQVCAFALTPSAHKAARSLKGRARLAEHSGSKGLIELLEDLDEDAMVLVVHDDVTVDVEDLRSLVHAARSGTPTLAGEISSSPQPVSLAVASVAQWRELATRGGVHPLASHLLVGWKGLPVRAAHSGVCVKAAGRNPRARIVAAMIAKDEGRFIQGAVRSALRLCDAVVVYDTGSSDDTVEKARSAGATVVEGEWRQDFAWARNQAIDAAGEADWILSLDADERLSGDVARLRRQLDSIQGEFSDVQVTIVNVVLGPLGAGDDGTVDVSQESSRFEVVRIFDPSVSHFVGKIHEHVMRRDAQVIPPMTLEDAVLIHFGYDPSMTDMEAKKARNLQLARAQFDRDGDTLSAINLMRALFDGHHDVVAEFELLNLDVTELPDRTAAMVLGLLCEATREADYGFQALRRADDDGAWAALARADGADLIEAWKQCNHTTRGWIDQPVARSAAMHRLARQAHTTGAREVLEAALRQGASGDLWDILDGDDQLISLQATYGAAPEWRIRARLFCGDVTGAISDAQEAIRLGRLGEIPYLCMASLMDPGLLGEFLSSIDADVVVPSCVGYLQDEAVATLGAAALVVGSGGTVCALAGVTAAINSDSRDLLEVYAEYSGVLPDSVAQRLRTISA